MNVVHLLCVLAATLLPPTARSARTDLGSPLSDIASLSSTVSELQHALAQLQVAHSALQVSHDSLREEHRALHAAHSQLHMSHDALSLEHHGLQNVVAMLSRRNTRSSGMQASPASHDHGAARHSHGRTLSSSDACVNYDDAQLVVEGTAVFAGDLLVQDGDRQTNVVDAVANVTGCTSAVDSLRQWLCLQGGSDTVARPFLTYDKSSAHDQEHFRIGDSDFLAVANYFDGTTYATKSPVYRFNGATATFELFQEIDTKGARGWTHFQIGARHFLAVANFHNAGSYLVTSAVFCYNDTLASFEVFQEFETQGATDWEHIQINNYHFLVVANERDDDGDNGMLAIYRFNNVTDAFESFQELDADSVVDLEQFLLGDTAYLLAASHRVAQSTLYQYNNSAQQFNVYQEFTTVGAASWEHMRINGQDYLAIANYGYSNSQEETSEIFRHNNATHKFELFQQIDTLCALDWEHFRIGDTDFLALCSYRHGTTYEAKSAVYRYNDEAQAFELVQQIDTKGCIDWEHFTMGGADFLALSEYPWGDSEGTASVMLCTDLCFL